MAAKPGLRAVKADESASIPAATRSVAVAAASGSHRELLVAMRERIAAAVSDPDCPPRDLASLTRRLQDIANEIDTIDTRAKQEAREDGPTSDAAWDDALI